MEKTDLKCDFPFVSQENILKHVDKFSQMANGSDQLIKNLSKSDINAAAEMFVYLNTCPSYHVKLYWKTIYGNQSRVAMLASNIIKRARDSFKSKAFQIFAKISSLLGFKYYISYHHVGTKRFDYNIIDVKGKTIQILSIYAIQGLYLSIESLVSYFSFYIIR